MELPLFALLMGIGVGAALGRWGCRREATLAPDELQTRTLGLAAWCLSQRDDFVLPDPDCTASVDVVARDIAQDYRRTRASWTTLESRWLQRYEEQ